ncbi:hypothetical protein FRC12_002096 [Ceratobasidium sp. 428]|nr:hypothetical protein FRC12_002096 [Ceratobasidium sp. 428]
MPADPEDQRDAREFERSLREDVLAGRADPAQLAWFVALPKRVRRSLRLIVETAKHDKAQLLKRRSTDKAPRVQDTQQLVPSTGPSLSDIEQNPWAERNPWAEPCTPEAPLVDTLIRAIATYPRPEPAQVQPRDLSCLRGDGNAWGGIGRRKKRCRAFCAIGRAYVCRQSIALPALAAAPVFTLEHEPEIPPRPDTPPDLREAVWYLQHAIYGVDGPSTPDLHSLASPEPESAPEPEPHPLYPPTPPPIEQIPLQPGELNVFGHEVDPYFAYVVMRGRRAIAPQVSCSLREAAVLITSAQYIVPGVLEQLASVLFPGGVPDFNLAVGPHEAVRDFCRGWYEVVH